MTSEQTVLMAMSQEIASLKSELGVTKELVETLDEHARQVNDVLLRLSAQNARLLSFITSTPEESQTVYQ